MRAQRFPLPSWLGSCVLLLAAIGSPRPSVAAEDAAWLASRWAASDLASIAGAVKRWREEKGAWPTSCAEAASAYLSPAPKADPWGTAYACSFEKDSVVVLSSGPDGKPGTADDLRQDVMSGPATATVAASPAPSAPAVAAASPAPPEAAATLTSLQRLAAGLESFRKKNGHFPVAEKAEHLERWLVAEHLAPAAWTSQDAWGRPLRYRTTDVGSSYTLASAGADGRWEALTGDGSGAGDADADLAIVDGRLTRWPSGLSVEPVTAASGPAASAPEPPRDPMELTRHRLQQFAALIVAQRRDGRFPESDDAERLARDLGARFPATDGWGRALQYQSAAAGAHFALASAGPDGRFATGLDALARGASPAADDVVVRDGALVTPGGP